MGVHWLAFGSLVEKGQVSILWNASQEESTMTDLMNKGRSGWQSRESDLIGLFAAPALILMLAFIVIPFIMAFVLAFTNQRLVPNLNVPTQFVGLRNYRRLLEDTVFHRALLNNFYFAIVVVPAQASLGLLLAILVNQKLRFVNIFRIIYFSPVAITTVVVSMIWGILYSHTSEGAINQLVHFLTFGRVGPQNWLGNKSLALPAIMLLSIWQGIGLPMTVYLAGLQKIPVTLYEAAQIDGADRIQQFFYITLPQLRNTTLFVLITTTILAFRLFTPVHVLTLGGPSDATTTTIYRTYVEGFRLQKIGYASAITIIFFLIILGVSLLQRVALREEKT
jgi:multiple sugar transport system permease protein